jgi:nucleoside-diphosphate-sugar epimerase
MKTCIVTGAGGYLGGCVKRNFAAAGWRVIEMTRAEKPGAISFRLGEDVRAELLAGADALVHCAYDFEPVTRGEIWAGNVRGSQKLFDAAARAGIGRLVFVSTISAFEGCKSLYGQAKLEIEKSAASHGALVIRPGLIWGDTPGGMMGRLIEQIEKSKIVPLIGDGTQPQYLVHEDDLCELIVSHCEGDAPPTREPVTAAHEHAWKFRDILSEIARARGRQPVFVKLPWRLIWTGLKFAESVGLRLKFRSDSVVSLMNQNARPSFDSARDAGLRARPFTIAATR